MTAAMLAGQQQEKAKRPNIVYVFADQWRASSIGYSGDKVIKTPAIDQLANDSLNFVNTVAVLPVCTPYRAALMTGRYPTTTGMFLNDLYLPSSELCIAEIFSEAGYDTAYIGKWHLDGHGRHAFIPPDRRQGWEYWKAAECEHYNQHAHYYTGDSDEKLFWEGFDVFAQTADAQNYILERHQSETPFILMLSFAPPHPASPKAPEKYREMYPLEDIVVPLNVPEELRQKAKEELQNYYALGTIIDVAIGDLLKTIHEADIADDTIFVFTSDHGGMIYSHGTSRDAKQMAWNESSHVPFLLRYPAAHGEGGRVVETPLNTPDILPTLLGLAGIEKPDTIEGEDLSQVITENTEIDRSVLFMSVAPFNFEGRYAYRAIRTTRYSYVRYINGSSSLFDNLEDPHQLNDLVADEASAELLVELEGKLQAHLVRIGDDFRAPEAYIEQWGYIVDEKNAIPYLGRFKVQSPKPFEHEVWGNYP